MWKEAHVRKKSLDRNVIWWAEYVLDFKKVFVWLHAVEKEVFMSAVKQGFS